LRVVSRGGAGFKEWRDGRRGQDGWGRYTRRRKWYRDAELVEATLSTEVTPVPTPRHNPADDSTELTPNLLALLSPHPSTESNTEPTLVDVQDATSVASDADASSVKSKRSWFTRKRASSTEGSGSHITVTSTGSNMSRRSQDDDLQSPIQQIGREDEWRLGDDIRQHLDI